MTTWRRILPISSTRVCWRLFIVVSIYVCIRILLQQWHIKSIAACILIFFFCTNKLQRMNCITKNRNYSIDSSKFVYVCEIEWWKRIKWCHNLDMTNRRFHDILITHSYDELKCFHCALSPFFSFNLNITIWPSKFTLSI